MAEEDNSQDKTEEPSQRKLDKAAEDGQVLSSKEMFVFTSLIMGLMVLSSIPFFAKDLTDEERQQLKRPVLADPMMANKVVLAHEAGHLYDDKFFKENMDVIYPLYEELLDGYGKERLYNFLAERFFSFYFEKYTKTKTWPYIFLNNDIITKKF